METGNYTLAGEQFRVGNKKFIFRKRKKPTGSKTELYLFQTEPRKQYISSLFPIENEEGLYSFDFQKRLYLLKKSETEVSIIENN